MHSTTLNAPAPGLSASNAKVLVGVYVATTVLSAFLLFLIQPIMARLTLPLLGGSSSVWALTMSFFQIALLVGYGYAHVVNKMLSPKMGIITHAGLLALVFLLLIFDVKSAAAAAPTFVGENL